MSNPIDLVLARLEPFKLRQHGRDRWRACCPAHGGSNPSALSVAHRCGCGRCSMTAPLDETQRRALARVRRCLDFAADARGNVTERETAWRQAQVLIAKHGLQLERFEAAAPAELAGPPPLHSPEWAAYWVKRTTAEAMAAGVRTPVLCRDGWLVG